MAVVLCYSSDTSLATTRRFILEGQVIGSSRHTPLRGVEEPCATEPIVKLAGCSS
jgi:hypothetical protein